MESSVGFDKACLALVSKGADTVYSRELGNDQQHQSQQLFFPSRYVCGYNILKMKTDNVAIILTSWLVLFGWFLGENEVYTLFWFGKNHEQLTL